MTTNKGRRTEKQFHEILLNYGYEEEQIETPRRTVTMIGPGRMISSKNDLFGLFDFLVKDKKHDILIQVKSNSSDVYKVKPEIKKWADLFCNVRDVVRIALKIPRKGFRIYTYHVPDQRWSVHDIDLKGDVIDVLR